MENAAKQIGLEELVVALYCAIDDALALAGIAVEEGKVIPRRGPPPTVDDREVLCLALLQEILGYESDHKFHLWLSRNAVMRQLFPQQISRQKFAERRTLLLPVLKRLCLAFAELNGDTTPLLPLSTRIPSRSAVW